MEVSYNALSILKTTQDVNPLSQLGELVTLREPKQKYMGFSPLQM
jgi:hypothetical protein